PKIATLEPGGSFAHFPFERFSEFYADFGSYDVTIDVPAGVRIGATGALSRSWTEGSRRLDEYTATPVHDFAFAAWDAFEEMDADAGGVAVRCLFPPGFGADAEREIAAVRGGLVRYGERYGA